MFLFTYMGVRHNFGRFFWHEYEPIGKAWKQASVQVLRNRSLILATELGRSFENGSCEWPPMTQSRSNMSSG